MSPDGRALRDALALYDGQSAGVRFHTRARAWTAPLADVVAAVPRRGRVLDVGCGHGLVANAIALRDEQASVLGVDISETKIASALRTVGARRNVAFRNARLEDVGETD